MPALFEWKQEYSVSVERFDSEHKVLFSLINELNEAMCAGQGRLIIGRVLQHLLAYTRTHFAAEASAMRQANYPETAQHIAEHVALTQEVEKFIAEFEAGHTTISMDVLYFLRDWLEKHIRETDRKYAATLNAAGIH